jgi:hypothetical protein
MGVWLIPYPKLILTNLGSTVCMYVCLYVLEYLVSFHINYTDAEVLQIASLIIRLLHKNIFNIA